MSVKTPLQEEQHFSTTSNNSPYTQRLTSSRDNITHNGNSTHSPVLYSQHPQITSPDIPKHKSITKTSPSSSKKNKLDSSPITSSSVPHTHAHVTPSPSAHSPSTPHSTHTPASPALTPVPSPSLSPRRSPRPTHTAQASNNSNNPPLTSPRHNPLNSPRALSQSAEPSSPSLTHRHSAPLTIPSPLTSPVLQARSRVNDVDSITPPSNHTPRQLDDDDVPIKQHSRPTTAQKLTIADFTLIEKIGQGGFGAVYLAKKNDNEEVVALKRMEKSFVLSKNRSRHVMNERDALVQGRDSPWLVRMLYSFQDAMNLYIAMEFVQGGDLRSLIEALGCVSEEHAQFYIAEIVESVVSCHSLGYCHRDIKPENFLIDKHGHIKLADFGLSKNGVDMYLSKLQSKSSSLSNSLSDLATMKDKSGKRLAYSVVGSPCYMAPEVVQQLGYGLEADWWSVGVILYELLSGEPPFNSDSPDEVLKMLGEWQKHLRLPRNVSMRAWDLIQGLIARPSARLTAAQIYEHPFFDGIVWDNLRSMVPPFVPSLQSETDTSYYNATPAERHYEIPQQLNSSSEKSILGFSFPRNSYDLKSMDYIELGIAKMKVIEYKSRSG